MREYTEAILIALLLALFIRTFVVQAFKIPSGSMLNTLLIGDHILVNKFIYGIKNPFNGNTWIPIKNPERGDVVVFKYPINPAQDYIYVTVDEEKLMYGLELIDQSGRSVYKRDNVLQKSTSVDLSEFSPGMYFLSIELEGDQRVFKKIGAFL